MSEQDDEIVDLDEEMERKAEEAEDEANHPPVEKPKTEEAPKEEQ